MNQLNSRRLRDRAATPHRALAVAVALAVCATTFFAGNADAQEVAPAAPATEAPTSEASSTYGIGPEAYVGGFDGSGDNGGMMVAGVSVLGHYGLLEGGLLYEGGSQILGGGSMTGTAGLLGVGYDVTPHFRVSLLGEAGYHTYKEIRPWLFGPSGVSGSSNYAGGRFGAQWSIGRDARLTLGLWLFVRDDFERQWTTTTTTTTTGTGLFGSETTTSTVTIGQWQTGLAFRIGFEGAGAF